MEWVQINVLVKGTEHWGQMVPFDLESACERDMVISCEGRNRFRARPCIGGWRLGVDGEWQRDTGSGHVVWKTQWRPEIITAWLSISTKLHNLVIIFLKKCFVSRSNRCKQREGWDSVWSMCLISKGDKGRVEMRVMRSKLEGRKYRERDGEISSSNIAGVNPWML